MSMEQGILEDDGSGLKLGSLPVGSRRSLTIRSSVACSVRPLGVDTTPLPIPADTTVHLGMVDLGTLVVDQTTAGEEVSWWADSRPMRRRPFLASALPPPPPPSGGGGGGTKPPPVDP